MPTQAITYKGKVLYTSGDGYYYKVFRRNKGDYRYFKCQLRRCQVVGTMPRNFSVDEDEIIVKGNHNHPPNLHQFDYIEAEKRIMERAVKEPTPLRQILQEELTNLTPQIAERFDSPGIIRRMQRRRHAEQQTIIPKTLTAFADQLLSFEFSNYANVDGRQFFIGSIGNEGLLFISPTMRDLLKEPNGTFVIFQTNKILGKNLKHIFIIAQIISYWAIPIVYVAHKQPDQQMFTNIFQRIIEEEPLWNPSTLYMYRDLALVSVVLRIFPGVDIQHGWFHIMQDLRKEVKRINLWQSVHADPDIFTCVEILQALPFIPVKFIAAGYNSAKVRVMNAIEQKEVQQLFKYVDENWMTEAIMQKISVYNHPERFMIELKQLHRQIASSFRVNPQIDMIWTFIKSLNILEKKYSDAYNTYISSSVLPRWTNTINVRSQHKKLQKYMEEFTISKMDSFFKDLSRLHINIMELIDEDLEVPSEDEVDEEKANSDLEPNYNSQNDENYGAEYEEFIIEEDDTEDEIQMEDVKEDINFVQIDNITNIEISDEELNNGPSSKRIKMEKRKSTNSTLIFSSSREPISVTRNVKALTSLSHQCLICNRNTYSYACQPCGHLCVCDDCKSEIVKNECPMCSKSVLWVQQIILPYSL